MQVFGLIGNPVGHSLSPPMHAAAYREHGIDARYVTFEPAPNDLAAAVSGARALGIVGLNVTIPFKRDVLDLCAPDDLAARIGAVNTLDFTSLADPSPAEPSSIGGVASDESAGGVSAPGEPALPRGYNTDAVGARRALEKAGVDLSGQAVVVGAGGAGRAIAFALAGEGMDVAIANRTTETARELAASLPEGIEASGHGLDSLPALLADARTLVNATSVGMGENESPVPAEALHADLAVLDAVYRPIETRLLREASAAGARTIDGATMLLHQGAASFERWTGRSAPIEAMDEALRARL
jgi:shikimate dehydrogenase